MGPGSLHYIDPMGCVDPQLGLRWFGSIMPKVL